MGLVGWGIGSAWGLARARTGRSVPDTRTGPRWEEGGTRLVLCSSLGLETREAGVIPLRTSPRVCNQARPVCLAERPLRFEIHGAFPASP
jgi:hypothetical protein